MMIPQFKNVGPLPVLTPFSIESIGSILDATGFDLSIAASATWGTANMVLYVPFNITTPDTVKKMFVMNGTTPSGVTHVGIYTEDFTRMVMASATQAGGTAIQTFDIADTFLGVGTYYMALASTSSTFPVFRVSFSHPAIRIAGIYQQLTAVPLPAIGTPAIMAQGFVPVFGLVFGDTI